MVVVGLKQMRTWHGKLGNAVLRGKPLVKGTGVNEGEFWRNFSTGRDSWSRNKSSSRFFDNQKTHTRAFSTGEARERLEILDPSPRCVPLIEPSHVTTRLCNQGIFAPNGLENGELVMFVKQDEFFCASNVYENMDSSLTKYFHEALVGYRALGDKDPVLFGELELALLLWAERRSPELTRWSNWVRTLPDSCSGTCPLLNNREIDEILGDRENEAVVDSVKSQASRLSRIVEILAEGIATDLTEVLEKIESERANVWGRGCERRQSWPFDELLREELSLVMSRSLRFDPEIDWSFEPQVAILPQIDMINHSFQPNARLVGTTKQGLKEMGGESGVGVVTLRNVQPGEEICIAYDDPLSGNAALLRYGFLLGGDFPWENAEDSSPLDLNRPSLVEPI